MWRAAVLRQRPLLIGAVLLFFALAAGAVVLITYVYPPLPREVVMATGPQGSGFPEIGERYRQIAAQQGVRITLHSSLGSVENLALLRAPESRVSVAFVQNGLTDAAGAPGLVSLGTVAYLPLWIFYRGPPAPRAELTQLRGMRVAVGPPGSGNRLLALALLARNGVDETNSRLLPLTPAEAADGLVAGTIDAALMLAEPDAPPVRRLLVASDVRLLPLDRAGAYVALYPFLTTVVLPAGFADLVQDRPPADARMIAVKMSLLVHRDLPSAVQYLLLEAGTQIHGQAGVFQKVGEFPAAEGTDLPLSADAAQFYKTGVPFLQRYLPLWLAVLVAQLAITVVPLAAVAYPLVSALPAAYEWSVRRRIALLYGELKLLELSLEQDGRDGRAALADLAALEHRVTHLRVPISFAQLLYGLRQDIGFVRDRLDRTAKPS